MQELRDHCGDRVDHCCGGRGPIGHSTGRAIDRALLYKNVYSNGYPTNLRVLAADGTGIKNCDRAQYLNQELASGLEAGYTFTPKARPPLQFPAQGCTFPGASGYTLSADPLDFDDPGKGTLTRMKPA